MNMNAQQQQQQQPSQAGQEQQGAKQEQPSQHTTGTDGNTKNSSSSTGGKNASIPPWRRGEPNWTLLLSSAIIGAAGLGLAFALKTWWDGLPSQRCRRAAAALAASTAPSTGVPKEKLIVRAQLEEAIRPKSGANGACTVLVSGAYGAGKSTVVTSACQGVDGVVYTTLQGRSDAPLPVQWSTKVLSALDIGHAPDGEDAEATLRHALEHNKQRQSESQQLPVFIADLDATVSSAELEHLLLVFKNLGHSDALARFIVISGARTAGRVLTCMLDLRTQVVEVGDLTEPEATQYLENALDTWQQQRQEAGHNICLTADQRSQMVKSIIAKCGTPTRTRLELLKRLSSGATVPLKAAAGAFGTDIDAFEVANMEARPTQPFVIDKHMWQVRAADTFAQHAMKQQAEEREAVLGDSEEV
ncbi:hypothetical protein JKP88DRAFT_283431 [Tribonema minus]|uniref:Uncharacterized protein n=1 Tax=Tribonema minus TaxID=303371 RepID=A0A835YJA9_9STRA|nr:hypothetical protein JKP88DRAFT_283431 [Tribonema minus]